MILRIFVLPVLLAASAAAAQQHDHANHNGSHDGHDPSSHSAGMDHQAASSAVPMQPGQASFGAIQEIVILLENNPDTDWNSVDINRLRNHLIDMDNVAVRANIKNENVKDGARFTITGSDDVIGSIKRMTIAHSKAMNGADGWTFDVQEISAGAVLTVTSAKDAQKIRALGYAGVMARGAHHQPHHLIIAQSGEH